MKKLLSAATICALAVGLTVAPSALAVKPPHAGGPKAPKQVSGTVSVFVVPNPVVAGTSFVTASGNVKASSNCRKDRDVLLTQWVNTVTGAPSPTGLGTVETGSNGDYSTLVLAPTTPGTYVLQAFVDDEFRKVGSKKKGKKNKKGRQFNCMEVTGQSIPETVSAPAS